MSIGESSVSSVNLMSVTSDSPVFDEYFLNERSCPPSAVSFHGPIGVYSTNDSSDNNSSADLSVNSSYLSQASSLSSMSTTHSGVSSTAGTPSLKSGRFAALTPQTVENRLVFDERGLNLTRATHAAKIGTIRENVAVAVNVDKSSRNQVKKNKNKNKKISVIGLTMGQKTEKNVCDQSPPVMASYRKHDRSGMTAPPKCQEKESTIIMQAKANTTRKKTEDRDDARNRKVETVGKARKKKVNDRVDGGVGAAVLHKYGLELDKSKKVHELTEFENTLYQNALWKTMIKDPNSFKNLRGKIVSDIGTTTKPV